MDPDRSRCSALVQSPSPLLLVEPSRGLVDEQVRITVRNLGVRQEVTVHCLHRSEDRDLWEAFGLYVSDQEGAVTVANDPSVGGTYEGKASMGLIWSLRPVPGSRTGMRLRKRDVSSPIVLHISVYNGHVTQGFDQLKPMVTVDIERYYMAPGTQRVDLCENSVRGTLFIPPGPGPFPGVLDLWGGGGGLVEYRAALLASHGFVALALEYMSPENLNTVDLDSSYFEVAYQTLQNHPMVLKDRVALLGLSFGATITLSMAANSRVIKPHCCVCISGSHVAPINTNLNDVFEEFTRQMYKVRFEDGQMIWRDIILPIPTDPTMKVNVGKIRCPLLLVVGEDDQNWATLESAEDIEQVMEKAENRHLLQILTYPGAGHLIEPPYSPHHRASNFMVNGKDKGLQEGGAQLAAQGLMREPFLCMANAYTHIWDPL